MQFRSYGTRLSRWRHSRRCTDPEGSPPRSGARAHGARCFLGRMEHGRCRRGVYGNSGLDQSHQRSEAEKWSRSWGADYTSAEDDGDSSDDTAPGYLIKDADTVTSWVWCDCEPLPGVSWGTRHAGHSERGNLRSDGYHRSCEAETQARQTACEKASQEGCPCCGALSDPLGQATCSKGSGDGRLDSQGGGGRAGGDDSTRTDRCRSRDVVTGRSTARDSISRTWSHGVAQKIRQSSSWKAALHNLPNGYLPSDPGVDHWEVMPSRRLLLWRYASGSFGFSPCENAVSSVQTSSNFDQVGICLASSFSCRLKKGMPLPWAMEEWCSFSSSSSSREVPAPGLRSWVSSPVPCTLFSLVAPKRRIGGAGPSATTCSLLSSEDLRTSISVSILSAVFEEPAKSTTLAKAHNTCIGCSGTRALPLSVVHSAEGWLFRSAWSFSLLGLLAHWASAVARSFFMIIFGLLSQLILRPSSKKVETRPSPLGSSILRPFGSIGSPRVAVLQWHTRPRRCVVHKGKGPPLSIRFLFWIGLLNLPVQVWVPPDSWKQAVHSVERLSQGIPEDLAPISDGITGTGSDKVYGFQLHPAPPPGPRPEPVFRPDTIGVIAYAPHFRPAHFGLTVPRGASLNDVAQASQQLGNLPCQVYDAAMPIRRQRFDDCLSIICYPSVASQIVPHKCAVLLDLSRVGGHYHAELLPADITLTAFKEHIEHLLWHELDSIEVTIDDCEFPASNGTLAFSHGSVFQVYLREHEASQTCSPEEVFAATWGAYRAHTLPISLPGAGRCI